MADDYRAIAKATLAEIKSDDVPTLAAGVAFKIFLALFPSLIAAVAIFSLVTDPDDLPRLMNALAVMPDEAIAVLERPLEDLATGGGGAAGGLAITAILGGLWAATSAAATLVKALNRAYEVDEARNFVKQRVVALALTLALLLTLAGLVLLLVVGRQVQDGLLPPDVVGTWISGAVGFLRFLGAVALIMLLFALTYWAGPNRERPAWQWMTPGAVVGVVGWLVAAGGFTLYAQTFGAYNETYGVLGGAVVLLLWLQISMMMLLIGAEVNSEIEKARRRGEDALAFVLPPAPSSGR